MMTDKKGTVLGATAVALATVAGNAAAAFNAASIETIITDNTAIGIGLVGLFILGVWSLRAMGLLKRG